MAPKPVGRKLNMRFCRILALLPLLLLSAFAVAPAIGADTAVEEQAAFEAIRKVASNIQKNRDGTVRFVRLSQPSVTDQHLTHLRAFKHLDYLAVVTPNVTDAGLASIAELTNLDTLFVAGTQLTDDGMVALRDLCNLQRVYLDSTEITDAGLKHLAGLTKLNTVSLNDVTVTDAGLEHLECLADLEALFLCHTAVTDDGLAKLANLRQLKTLRLAYTSVTGQGLAHLGSLKRLETLDLSGTHFTREHLQQLAQNTSLKRLFLYDTDFPAEAYADVKTCLPDTSVHLSPAKGQEQTAFERFLAGSQLGRAKPNTDLDSDPSLIRPSGHSLIPPPRERFVTGDAEPDFQRHVIPLLGRLGCNGRTCHGAFQGQGGFRLSMFGYDFEADHAALVAGGRVERVSAEDSLILSKPTSDEDHEGGQRYERGGWEYQLLLRWIRDGARGAVQDAAKLLRLDVTPSEIVFSQPGDTTQLKVVAVWSNGTHEDVTCLARFQTNDDTVAEVTPDGLVRAKGPGDTFVISFYDSGVFSTQTILPVSGLIGDSYPNIPTPTEIDKLVIGKLAKLGMVPSELCSDKEFLRRVSLDMVGTLPTPGEILEFVADVSSDKRQRKLDELLQRESYVAWWTNLLCDLTGSNPQFLGTTDMNRPAAVQWRDWIRRRVRDNVGWDRIAAGILLATSRRPGQTYDHYADEQSSFQRRDGPADYTALDNPMHYYWFRSNLQLPADRALSFGYVFLGIRLQCAQCHKHPFDQWSKQEFERFTEFFTRVKSGAAPDAVEAQLQLKTKLGVPVKLNTAALRRQMYMRVAAEGKPIPWNEIYIQPPGDKPNIAKLLGADEIDISQFDDPREPLSEWLVSRDNPYFSRAFVNRVWSHYFNVGIVDPPDDLNLANPPSNKRLLDWLAEQFVERGYDMRWLHRTITSSRTYQLSWRPNDTNRHDERNFSHAIVRRLPAEVIIDGILQATANDDKSASLAVEVEGRKIAQHPKSIQTRGIDYSLLVFGKPLRMTNCDCERQVQPSLLQSLYVRNDHELLGWLERQDGWLVQVARELGQTLVAEVAPIAQPQTAAVNRKTQATSDVVDRLVSTAYLRTLSRMPKEHELERVRRHIAESDNTVEGLRDLMWALLNTQEFLTNH